MSEIRVRGLDEGPFKAAVLRAVSQIPPGRVASWDDIAESLGYPTEAGRLVGWVVAGAPGGEVPWHRVVRPDGTLPRRTRHTAEQAGMLESEGVEVLPGPRVDPERYGWKPALAVRHRGPIVSAR